MRWLLMWVASGLGIVGKSYSEAIKFNRSEILWVKMRNSVGRGKNRPEIDLKEKRTVEN